MKNKIIFEIDWENPQERQELEKIVNIDEYYSALHNIKQQIHWWWDEDYPKEWKTPQDVLDVVWNLVREETEDLKL